MTEGGGSYISAVHDSGGLSPISRRTSWRWLRPLPEHHTLPSAGLTAGE